jgi:amino acid permease
VGGWWQATHIINLAVAIKCFGVAVSYLIVVGNLLTPVMVQLTGADSDSPVADYRLWIGVGFLSVAPLSFLDKLNSLRHFRCCLSGVCK